MLLLKATQGRKSMNAAMVVAGTRPEIVKMAPVLRAFHKNRIPCIFVHCGQHYDYNMSQQFIDDLNLPAPDYGLKIEEHSQGAQTAAIMIGMEKLMKRTSPRVVLVEGDTNSVLATALAAVKLGIPVAHVEAGLRSFDLRMAEEHNRRLTDHVSTYLLAPTKTAERNLKKENVWGKIYITGNTVIDSIVQHLPLAEARSKILEDIAFTKFVLVTAHRAENVDDPKVLRGLIEALLESPVPVVYPMHPRTRKRLSRLAIRDVIEKSKNLQILPPLGYLDFLVLMKKCEMIVTDSGGIQEEATAPCMRKPVLIIRLSTERPEAVGAGFAKVVGTEKPKILSAIDDTLEHKVKLPNKSPYGEGNSAEKIAAIVKEEIFQ